MKHIFENVSNEFPTSKNNYFKLHDIEKDIWRFSQNNEATSFHIRGTPETLFENMNLSLIDAFSCRFADINEQLLDGDGFTALMSQSNRENIELNDYLIRCAKDLKFINAALSSSFAKVNKERIKQYIKDGDL
jgi:septation ring formation regulator EzrA